MNSKTTRVVPFTFLALTSALFGVACDTGKKPEPNAGPTRGEVVAASAVVQTVETKKPETHAAVPTTKRKLCDKAPAARGKKLMDVLFEGIGTQAGGKAHPLNQPPGTVTWVNAWAGWCGPCKEEIPRLLGWEKKLQSAGKKFQVAFVSLDDDLRQAEKFLATQPADGLKGSLYLPEGGPRAKLFEPMKMKSDPELPVHLLFDGHGELACIVEGAVDENDYAEVERIASGL